MLFTPPQNDVFVAVNAGSINVPYTAFGSTTYPTHSFTEGAVNITHLFNLSNPGICTSANYITLFVTSQQGASFSSGVADFVEPIPFKFDINSSSISYDKICKNASNKIAPVHFGAGAIEVGSFSSNDLPAGALHANGDVDITNVTAGTYHITFTYLNACGDTKTAQATIEINTAPTVNAGSEVTICTGSSTTLAASGATTYLWSPSTGLSATTGASVTASPTATTTYTVTGTDGNSCSNTATVTVNVNTAGNVDPGTISGTTPLCIGATPTFTSNGTSGGTWSSDAPGVASVNAGTGVVTAVSAGNATISYTVTGCNAPAAATLAIIVSPDVTTGTISGTTPLCIGATPTFTSNGTSGGTWSSDAPGVASVNAGTGVVTAVSAGDATISYTVTGCNAPAAAQLAIVVSPDVTTGTISGTTPLCIGATPTFTSNGTSGGTWSSDAPGVASVNANTGVVTAVSAGDAIISYTVTGCNAPAAAQLAIVVSPNVTSGTISGTTPLCIGATPTFTSNGTPGGTWSSDAPGVASVNANTGVVTAVSAGDATISYTVTGCNAPAAATLAIIVSPNVTSGTISGTTPLCIGATPTFTSNGTPGGTWSSDAPGVASVNANTGVVTAVSSGNATISYTVTGCNAPAAAVLGIVVSPNVTTGTISGTTPLCIGATPTFTSNGTSGGTWSSDAPGVASVNAGTGVVTAVSAGDATISYTVTGCNAPAAAKLAIIVSPNVTSGTISGTTPLCIGATPTFTSNGTAGGTWSSDAPGVASVNANTGVVTAVSAGDAIISYTVTGCNAPAAAQLAIVVSPNVTSGTISGTTPLCIGATPTFTSNGTPGGTWSSDAPGVASVNANTGVVTAVSAGNATISYTVTGCNAPAAATLAIIVSPNVTSGTISGTTPLCIGATPTFTSNGTSGGTWSSDAPGVASVNANTGVVTAVSAGNATISYTVTGCNAPAAATLAIIVSPNVTSGTISGTTPLCIGATPTFTSNGTSGGTWSSNAPGVASVNAGTGVVTAVSAGDATISYTVTGCNAPAAATLAIIVSPDANSGTLTGTTPLCINGTATYTSNGTSGGTWSSSNTTVATISSIGLVTAKNAGTTTISYLVSGCNQSPATKLLTVSPNSLCTNYYGDYFANTSSTATGGGATVTLIYNISSDPNAVCNSKTGLGVSDFTMDIDPDPNVQSVTEVAGSRSYNNGIFTAKYTITLKSTVYSGTVLFTLGTTSTSNFSISSSCSDNPLITVSSKSDGFVTGGGFIIPTNSGGNIGGTPVNGLKNNFGFNIKFNKAGKLQGNWNTVIRRKEGTQIVVYQVKSNVASTLVVTQIPGTKKYRADMTFTSANFKNLTCSLCPVGANNGTVVVTVFDIGEPGAGIDSILISIRDKDNNLWYTSHNPGSHNSSNSDVQLLNQGNIQIHTLGAKAAASTQLNITSVSNTLNLGAFPNPSQSDFTMQVQGNNQQTMTLAITDVTGRTVQTFQNLHSGQTLRVGSAYKKGMYLVELVQGDNKKQLKLIKL